MAGAVDGAVAGAVDGAADRAARAFAGWSGRPFRDRRAVLNRAAGLLAARRAGLVDLMQAETGIARSFAELNVDLGVEMLEEAAALASRVEGRVLPSGPDGAMSFCLRQPAGVVLAIAPWNAPVALGVRAIALPLACGNTVILKASDLCPRVHGELGAILAEAGIGDALQVLVTAPEASGAAVERLIARAEVRRVNFTGSSRVGRQVAEACGRQLKRCLLELSAKSALLMLADCDLDRAVDAALQGAFLNGGQICMSTERLIVDARIADAAVARLAARAPVLAARPGWCDAAIAGEAARRLRGLVEDALARGAVLVWSAAPGGDPEAGPVILDQVDPSMRLHDEEVFGPLLYVQRAADEAEAIALANDGDYGLVAAVFTGDAARGLAVARQLETGICHINGATVQDQAVAPFGGMKGSGAGRFGGEAGIEEFTELRWLTLPLPAAGAGAAWDDI
ncbi:MAG: aldehyde dehydrogenase family protein [Sneathiellaceae bacterium]